MGSASALVTDTGELPPKRPSFLAFPACSTLGQSSTGKRRLTGRASGASGSRGMETLKAPRGDHQPLLCTAWSAQLQHSAGPWACSTHTSAHERKPFINSLKGAGGIAYFLSATVPSPKIRTQLMRARCRMASDLTSFLNETKAHETPHLSLLSILHILSKSRKHYRPTLVEFSKIK